jgi:hypothetical protein
MMFSRRLGKPLGSRLLAGAPPFFCRALGVTRRIVWAWILTIPGAALFGAAIYRLVEPWLR